MTSELRPAITITPSDLDDLVNYAFRYCVNRKTYAFLDGINIVEKFAKHCSQKTIYVLIRDIEREIDHENVEAANQLNKLSAYLKTLVKEPAK